MQIEPDDLLWISESRLLEICGLPRSTFQSWARAGLDIVDPGGAYALDALVAVSLLVAARPYVGTEELIMGWRELERTGASAAAVNAARRLKQGDRFDLVIETKHGGITVVRDDLELVSAIRETGFPRPIVVVDAAERVLLSVKAFDRFGKATPRPESRRPGRPRKEGAELRLLDRERAR